MRRLLLAVFVPLVTLGCGTEPSTPREKVPLPTEVLDKLEPTTAGPVEIDGKTLEHLKLLTGELGEVDFPSTRDVIAQCEQGSASACVSVATRLMYGTWGLEKDQPAAVALYEHACAASEMEGCHSLAVALEYGRGVAQDEVRATELFELACDGGNVVACSFFGDAYRHGRGVEKDMARAVEIYEGACLLGSFCRDVARHRLTLEQDGTAAPFGDPATTAVEACGAGNAVGCWHQALALARETDSDANYARIEELLSAACAADHGDSCDSLGFHYLHRQASPGYAAKASGAFQRACDLGAGCSHARRCPAGDPTHVRALSRGVGQAGEDCETGDMDRCLSFAISLKTGNGIERDHARAAELFDRVCTSGDPYGCWYLGGAYQRGQGVAADDDRAAALFRKACDADHANGCVDLAFAHVHGRGVPQDLPTAITLFDKACTLGTACEHATHYRTQLP